MQRQHQDTGVRSFFHAGTSTVTYVVHDPSTGQAALIDSVMDYDPYSGRTSTKAIDQVMQYIVSEQLSLQWILDTHIHADHITGSSYVKQHLGGAIGIGSGIVNVLQWWVPIFNTAHDTDINGSQFDRLFQDQDTIPLGHQTITIWHTPGHTPACVSYLIGNLAFVGDTLFMPDVGTARTDFPGGSAEALYQSARRLLSLPSDTLICSGHDYPPANRPTAWQATVTDHQRHNVLVHTGISQEDYVFMRHQRDRGKPVPTMLLPSIQANLRAGGFGAPESNGRQYIKVPINSLPHTPDNTPPDHP